MGINSQGVAYNYGQLGSAITDSTSGTLHAPKGGVIIAIQTLATTTFDASGGLVSELQTGRLGAPEFFNTEAAANDSGDTTSTASTYLTELKIPLLANISFNSSSTHVIFSLHKSTILN